jgi:hypothetical protein
VRRDTKARNEAKSVNREKEFFGHLERARVPAAQHAGVEGHGRIRLAAALVGIALLYPHQAELAGNLLLAAVLQSARREGREEEEEKMGRRYGARRRCRRYGGGKRQGARSTGSSSSNIWRQRSGVSRARAWI